MHAQPLRICCVDFRWRLPVGGLVALETDRDQEIFVAIRNLLLEIKAETAPIRADAIKLSSELGALPLAIDSVDLMKLIIGIEEAFGPIAEDFLEDLRATPTQTVSDLVRVVKNRLGSVDGREVK
jgi:acyl carrier protein